MHGIDNFITFDYVHASVTRDGMGMRTTLQAPRNPPMPGWVAAEPLVISLSPGHGLIGLC
jgi:hypothetical protein